SALTSALRGIQEYSTCPKLAGQAPCWNDIWLRMNAGVPSVEATCCCPLHHCSYDPAIRASTSAALLSARSRSGSFGLLTSRSAQAVAPPRRRSPIAAILWIFNMCRLSSEVELNAERPCPEVGVLVAFHPCEGSRAEVTATLADLRIVAAVVRPRHEVAPGEDQREAVEGVEDREAAELRRA